MAQLNFCNALPFCQASRKRCQAVGSKDATWIHLLVQNKYGGLLFQVARYVGVIKAVVWKFSSCVSRASFNS